jgi:hypothetical protein
MANTTVRGAQAIHGQNPQVFSVSLDIRGTQLHLVPCRNCNPKSYIRIALLEGALFRVNRQVLQVTLFDSELIISSSGDFNRSCNQSSVYWGRLWESKADRIYVPSPQAATNSTRERDPP